MNSLFNWNCCSSKQAQNKEHDLNFEEERPTPGIMKKTSVDSIFELKSKGSKKDLDQDAKLLKLQAIKQLRKS